MLCRITGEIPAGLLLASHGGEDGDNQLTGQLITGGSKAGGDDDVNNQLIAERAALGEDVSSQLISPSQAEGSDRLISPSQAEVSDQLISPSQAEVSNQLITDLDDGNSKSERNWLFGNLDNNGGKDESGQLFNDDQSFLDNEVKIFQLMPVDSQEDYSEDNQLISQDDPGQRRRIRRQEQRHLNNGLGRPMDLGGSMPGARVGCCPIGTKRVEKFRR